MRFGLIMTIIIFDRQTEMNPLDINKNYKPQDRILTPGAMSFVSDLAMEFSSQRRLLLACREKRQDEFNAGTVPGFCPETASIRESDWQVAEIPTEAQDRRTEITGPVSRKMVINALNSGAQVFMADFEDSTAPSWENIIDGQINLIDAVSRNIEFCNDAGKQYRLNANTALLMVRPRGWHLPENHVRLNGEAISASLFDFALFLFHNHSELASQGTAPYFYLPKLEHYLEARLWNDVINWSETRLNLSPGTVKVTVLIETLPAAFQMDEILYELRTRIQGLNCGRWDYIFSYIKTLRNQPQYLLPDRAEITMDKGFLNAYSTLLIKTCHRRQAMAMGGMAAQIPIRNNVEANQKALEKVRADKRREANAGHDGTWVAHPGLEPIARAEFDAVMPTANQIDRQLEDQEISVEEMLKPISGSITRQGLKGNIKVALLYLSAWLGGNGCVPIDHLMEDAATAEISRAQLWQWIRHPRARLEDGSEIDLALYQGLREEILEQLLVGADSVGKVHLNSAAGLLDELTLNDDFAAFLTLSAYEMIT